ncbi:MAG TPA: trypsin-like peptidase domain-containing protein [Bryobacteraceae bacterium]|nr:trypsin-like peptidase domain-containing protein [Bryobacteraceae bacterium]
MTSPPKTINYLLLSAIFISGAPGQKAPATPNPQKMDVLRQLSGSFEEISQRSGRAVVQIFVRSYVTPDNSSNNNELLTAENSSGSGIILTPDGYILTNAHVVKNAHSVKVQLNVRAEAEAQQQGDHTLNRPLPGTLVGVDRESDLAVIKIDRTNLPYLQFGDSDELKQGQIVLALGNPLGLDNSVSLGVVSAVARQIKTDDPMVYIQTDAPINPGNSGGPLVDADGRVMGINTFILTQSGGSEGIGFAIPSNLAKQVFAQLRTQGHVHRAQLGLYAETITPAMAEGLDLETDHGVLVSDLRPEGAADHAGIKVDDIITAVNDRRIASVQQLNAQIYRLSPGSKVSLRVHRGDEQLDLLVVTEEQSGEELDALADLVDPVKNVVPELGIVGLDITKAVLQLMPDLRRPEGVVVVARKSSPAFSGPALETGDVIYSVNRNAVPKVADLQNAVAHLKPGQAAVLLVEREGHLIYIPLELD